MDHIHTFWPHKDMEGLPGWVDEWSAQCRGHIRDSTNMKDNTHQAHTQSSQQGEDGIMMTTAKWYSGTLGAESFLTFVLQARKAPEKTSSRKLVQTGDRTRARCVTSAHATSCSTAVDMFWSKTFKFFCRSFRSGIIILSMDLALNKLFWP